MKTKIIVPFCPKNLKEIKEADPSLYQEADILEWRADFLATKKIISAAKEVFSAFKDFPIIFTLRTVAEGGNFSQDLTSYDEIIYKIASDFSPAYIDLEAVSKPEVVEDFEKFSEKLLLSYHNFEKIPENLPMILADMVEKKPAIVKIAVTPQNQVELWQLLQTAEIFRQSFEIPLIVIALGKFGRMSRLITTAPFTFAGLSKAETIGGQLTLHETKQILEILES